MKKTSIRLFMLPLVFMLLLLSCSSDSNSSPYLDLGNQSVTFTADAPESISVDLSTNIEHVLVRVVTEGNWCRAKIAGDKLVITAEPNEQLDVRTANIVLSGGSQGEKIDNITVAVKQEGHKPYIELEGETSLDLNGEGGEFTYTVKTNLEDWEIVIPTEYAEWIQAERNDDIVTITISTFQQDKTREGAVTFAGKGDYSSESIEVVVVQKGEPLIFTIPLTSLDFDKSLVLSAMADNSCVAEISMEYLSSGDLDGQYAVVYPVVDNKVDLSQGLIIQNGGTVAWDVSKNNYTYTPGSGKALDNLYLKGNQLVEEIEVDKTLASVKLKPKYLRDARDGQDYPIVKIGTYYWMAENLRAKKYSNGDDIIEITEDEQWADSTEGAFRMPFNNADGFKIDGGIYNGYAVFSEKGLAPKGWKIPTEADYNAMKKYIGKDNAFKLSSIDFWEVGNGTNLTGFNAYASGFFLSTGGEQSQKIEVFFWTTTKEYDFLARKDVPKVAWIHGEKKNLMFTTHGYEFGHFVRCTQKIAE